MRNPHAPAVPSRLLPLALSGLAALSVLAGCTPDLEDKLSCLNSTQCPTGYYCAADGKCQVGATVPELALITPTTGVIFSGVVQLQISAIDPAGITSVTVALGGADAGAPIAATAGANNIYTASVDTRALGVSTNGSFGIVITGTNANGKTSTLQVTLQIDDQPPAIGSLTINPGTVAQGQPATITFNVGETLSVQPQVKLTPPDGSSPRYAAYVSTASNSYSYQFIPLSTDPTGAWKVLVTAQDSYGNSASSSGNDTLNVAAGGTNSVTLTGKRGDGVTTLPNAYYLKSGATLALTATFGAPLSGAPSAYLCPVGTPGPCAANTTGSQPLTLTASSGTVYVANLTATPAVNNEGTHVVTVSGQTTAGATVSGSVQVVYDFTAPVFNVQQLNGSNNYDHLGRQMVSMAGTGGSLIFLAALNEPTANMSSVSANVDGTGPTVPPYTHATEGAALPQFQLTLDGSLKTAPPVPDSFAGHYVSVVACDLATNCTTATTQSNGGLGFVEVDATPAVFSYDCPSNADGGCGAPGNTPYGPTAVYRAGQKVTIDVHLDRELAYDQTNDLTIEVGNSGNYFSFSEPTPPESTGNTPFVYTYEATIFPGTPDGTYPLTIDQGQDGYGNNLTTTPPTTGPNIQVKTSIPNLLPATPAGAQTMPSAVTVSSSTQGKVYFISQSNSGVDDNLALGVVSYCLNPQASGGVLSCANAQGVSGLSLSYAASTAPTGNAIQNNLGVVTINATSNAPAGAQELLIEFTDAAGNVGLLPVTVIVNAVPAPPSIAAWSIDNPTPAPKQTVNLTVTFFDQGTMTSVAGILASGFNQVIPGSIVAGTVTQVGTLSYKIPFTLPAKCDGVNGDPAAASFNIGVTATDSAGNAYNSFTASPPLNPAPSITCIPAPAITNVAFNKTIVPAGQAATATVTLNEALGSITGATVTGSAATAAGGALAGVVVSQGVASSGNPRQYTVTYTMPSTCNGASGSPSDGVPFSAFVTLFDGANSTLPLLLGNLTCANAPRVLDYNWNTTVVAQGGTATATLTVNEPLTTVSGSSATSYTSGISFNPAIGSAANPVSNDPLAYTIAVTFSSCPLNGTGGTPPDATPIAINATLSDGIHAPVTTPIGSVTCTTTSIANASTNPGLVFLTKQPYPDGTVRSTIAATPDAISNWSGSGAGITLVATNGSTVVGTGSLQSDGSIGVFQLSSALTQVTLTFTDLLGNTKVVQAGKYQEQLLINATGSFGVVANENPFQVYDVGTGDDTFYAAPYWVDGGPGPDGGNATLVLSTLADGGLGTAALAMSELASIDDQLLSVSSAPLFNSDGGATGQGHMTYLGTEPFGNPLFVNADGGTALFSGAAPGPRTFGGMIFAPYSAAATLIGGLTPNTSQPADTNGTYWTWTRDNGWSKNSSAGFDGGQPANLSFALGYDNSQDLMVIGGNINQMYVNTIAGLYTTYQADGGSNQWWGNAGTIGTPLGDGGVAATAGLQIYSSASGNAPYQFEYNSAGANYISNTTYPFTIMNTSGGGIDNCLVYMPGCGTPESYCPGGSTAIYSCANSSGLAGSSHTGAALAVGGQYGSTFGFFSFGGRTGGASNDFYGGQVLFNSINESFSVNWVALASTNGQTPPARYYAQLYYIPQTNRIGLYGGYSASNTVLTDSWEYDLGSGAWVEVDNPHADAITAPGREYESATSYNGNLYIFGGNNDVADGWTMGRESRNRVIARLPVASQLSNPSGASVSQLNVTVANPNSAFNQGRIGPRELGEGPNPDLTIYDSYSYYDLYLWTGAAWEYVTGIGNYVESLSIPAAQLPSILASSGGDGNIYLMVAGAPSGNYGQAAATINLDALQFTLTFQ